MLEIRRKDPILTEAIGLLDARFTESQGDINHAYSMLSSFELNFIEGEIEKCMDFRYYAENYHVINSKRDGIKTLYPFLDSQEIFYAEVIKIQINGEPVQIIVLKARQLGLCLDPETKVLTSDLFWVPIKNVRVGEELVAVDENVPGGRGRGRKMRTTRVLAKREVFEEAFKITMRDGRILIATKQHRFLSKRRGAVDTMWRSVGDMRAGDHIRYITKPWDVEQRYEDGWFSGILDGEGSMRVKKNGGVEISASQRAGDVYDRAFDYLQAHGYAFREEVDKREGGEKSKLGNKPVWKLVMNRMNEIFQLLGQTRPSRFRSHWWEGKDLPGKNSGEAWETIIDIQPLPAQRMIDLQTDTKTFIAEGFVSHNSTINEALIFHRTIFTEGCNTLIVAQDPGQADYLFGMTRLAYDSLPWWMRPEARYEQNARYLGFDRRDETLRITNPGLRSAIFVEAANKMTGVAVGKALTALHMSELSLWPDAKILAEQIFPTLAKTPNQIAVMESTARGRNNFWHDIWKHSVEGKVPWKPIFIEFFRLPQYSMTIPVNMNFTRTKEEVALCAKVIEVAGVSLSNEQLYWRRQEMQTFATLNRGDVSKFWQEYPGATWVEAFQGSGICAFNKSKLQMILESTCLPPVWYGEIDLKQDKGGRWMPEVRLTRRAKHEDAPNQEDYGGRLYVWEQPEEGAKYYIAADVAHGVYGGDFSCAEVIRIGHGTQPDVQVAEWHGWINPTPYGDVLAALGYWYNTAEISVECNDIGLTTNSRVLRVLEYPNLFRWKHYDKLKNFISDFLGWYTNVKTRDQIIAKFREYIDDGMIIIRSQNLIDECFDFAQDESGGRFEGQTAHDDRVMAVQIAIFCAHDMEGYGTDEPGPRKRSEAERENICLCGHAKDMHGNGRDCGNCQECPCPIWRQMFDYANTDFSPTHDRGKEFKNPNEVETPQDYSLWTESGKADDEAWKYI